VAARLGGHGHLQDWIELLPVLRCDALVLAHLPAEATADQITRLVGNIEEGPLIVPWLDPGRAGSTPGGPGAGTCTGTTRRQPDSMRNHPGRYLSDRCRRQIRLRPRLPSPPVPRDAARAVTSSRFLTNLFHPVPYTAPVHMVGARQRRGMVSPPWRLPQAESTGAHRLDRS
jgi:hypothetical protein